MDFQAYKWANHENNAEVQIPRSYRRENYVSSTTSPTRFRSRTKGIDGPDKRQRRRTNRDEWPIKFWLGAATSDNYSNRIQGGEHRLCVCKKPRVLNGPSCIYRIYLLTVQPLLPNAGWACIHVFYEASLASSAWSCTHRILTIGVWLQLYSYTSPFGCLCLAVHLFPRLSNSIWALYSNGCLVRGLCYVQSLVFGCVEINRNFLRFLQYPYFFWLLTKRLLPVSGSGLVFLCHYISFALPSLHSPHLLIFLPLLPKNILPTPQYFF